MTFDLIDPVVKNDSRAPDCRLSLAQCVNGTSTQEELQACVVKWQVHILHESFFELEKHSRIMPTKQRVRYRLQYSPQVPWRSPEGRTVLPTPCNDYEQGFLEQLYEV